MRSGVIAQKVGMTRVFTEAGEHIPVTVLKLDNVQVMAHRTNEKNGYTALQLGAGSRKAARLTKSERESFARVNVEPKRKVVEFRVTPENMIAVGSEQKSAIGALLLGSVTRALAAGAKQSILVARPTIASGPVRAVLAVDGSAYCDRCVDHLINFQPKGLGHVTVLQVIEPVVDTMSAAVHVPIATTQEVYARMEEFATNHTQQVVDKLTAAGIEASPVVRTGPVLVTIRKVVQDTDSEMIILGAQGHGFMHRVLIGSIAMHVVASESYSALIMRA